MADPSNPAVYPDRPPSSPLAEAIASNDGDVRSGRQSVRAGSLMVFSNGVQLAVAAGVVAVMARLLAPADFGLFAMGAVLLGLVATFRDFGLPAATLQKHELRDTEVSALFWLNLKLNLVLTGCMVVAAPALAWFFERWEVVGIALALAAGGMAASVSTLHLALLGRQMRFGAITAMEILAVVTGGAVGIGSAVLGAGYWALVLQLLITLAVHATLPWLLCGWRPLGYQQSGGGRIEIGRLLAYGTSLSLSRVITYAGQNVGIVLVGRFAGAGALGLYQSAYRWATLPVHQVYKPLDQVIVSSFRPLRDDEARYRAAMAGAVRATAALVLPIVAFIGVAAHDVVRLLLGAQWMGAVPIFRVLAIAAFLDVVRLSTKWLYLTEGRTDRQLRFTLISAPIMVLGMVVGVMWGAVGVAWGLAVAILLLVYPTASYCLATSPLSRRDFWGALATPAGAALFASVPAAAALTVLPYSGLLLRLSGTAAAFGAGYAVAWIAAPGGRRTLREIRAATRLLWRPDGRTSRSR